ncbi:MAG: UDP-N-acetylglucosamine 4,6-dehydratase (inverting) [Candidatus Kuenenbacteria bacterium]
MPPPIDTFGVGFTGKTVLITGGTGSFGKNFANYLLKNTDLKKLIIFSRDERKQFQMRQQINDPRIRFFIGDVRDLDRLKRAFNGVDIVVHAAALKHIPILEYNPFEAVKTNILGSQNVIDAAIDIKVKKVLLISTDKAAEPVNLYGSTKLCAEKLFISGNSYTKGETIFSCVRYGNVLGSRGSIVETLISNKKKNAEKVNLTDEQMTRFWITLSQAIQLVLFALKNMNGGEIFIPKPPSMKLTHLFEVIVPNIPRQIIGIRPGEKLHEILITKDEARHTLDLGKYFVILPEDKDIFDIDQRFSEFIESGRRPAKNFSFSSDNNTRWLMPEDLKKILKLI